MVLFLSCFWIIIVLCILECMLSHSVVCNPLDCSLLGSAVHGIFQARILEQVAISYSRESSQPRDGIRIFCIPCTDKWIPYHQQHLGSPPIVYTFSFIDFHSLLSPSAYYGFNLFFYFFLISEVQVQSIAVRPFFFLLKIIYNLFIFILCIFIFGCAGSSLLRVGFSPVAAGRAYSFLWCAGFSL